MFRLTTLDNNIVGDNSSMASRMWQSQDDDRAFGNKYCRSCSEYSSNCCAGDASYAATECTLPHSNSTQQSHKLGTVRAPGPDIVENEPSSPGGDEHHQRQPVAAEHEPEPFRVHVQHRLRSSANIRVQYHSLRQIPTAFPLSTLQHPVPGFSSRLCARVSVKLQP